MSLRRSDFFHLLVFTSIALDHFNVSSNVLQILEIYHRLWCLPPYVIIPYKTHCLFWLLIGSFFDLDTEAGLSTFLNLQHSSWLWRGLSQIIFLVCINSWLSLNPRIEHLLFLHLLIFGGTHTNGGVPAFEAVVELSKIKSVVFIWILFPLIEHFGKRYVGGLAKRLRGTCLSSDNLSESGVSGFHSNLTIRL